jgi:hypothetical protein
MGNIYPSPQKAPSIMMIGGREHVLYHGLFEPLKIVDAKFLWLNSVLVWALALYTVLLLFTLGDDGWWSLLAVVAAAVPVLAVGAFIENRSGVTTPVAIDEKDRSGTWSRLVISTRRHGPLTTTVHTDMADFLLATIADGQTRRFTSRPEIPFQLRHPGIQQHVWIAAVGWAIEIPAAVALWVYLIVTLAWRARTR